MLTSNRRICLYTGWYRIWFSFLDISGLLFIIQTCRFRRSGPSDYCIGDVGLSVCLLVRLTQTAARVSLR